MNLMFGLFVPLILVGQCITMKFVPSGPVYDRPPPKMDQSIHIPNSFLASSKQPLGSVAKNPPTKINPSVEPPDSLLAGSQKNVKNPKGISHQQQIGQGPNPGEHRLTVTGRTWAQTTENQNGQAVETRGKKCIQSCVVFYPAYIFIFALGILLLFHKKLDSYFEKYRYHP
ncbi:hypothetical protein PGTUg99_035889 [Puccinia graminis f. sp. tritici]|uniref:Uncharacterized protein n=2 Tax=Puccinia graminis f. sp. tritici TaxID=56615 RepID=A0A5B0R970_PUCGR|nr:hypothetical protein PGTUg99_035889 [Puccinia graminis f. sp. tritici]